MNPMFGQEVAEFVGRVLAAIVGAKALICGALLSDKLRKSTLPAVSFLLGDPSATKAALRFLANSGRFDSLYSPPERPPASPS